GSTFYTSSGNAPENNTTSADYKTKPAELDLSSDPGKRNGFELFDRILQNAYQRIAIGPDELGATDLVNNQASANRSTAPLYQSTDKTTATQASGAILGYISQQLQVDEANGASQEELFSRLDAGLNGFLKGFNEAKTQIEDMGLLTPDTAAKINDTYDRVTNGIEQLRNKITGDASNISRLTLDTEHSQRETFSLQLITQDGDTVSIDISRETQSGTSASVNLAELTASYNQSSYSSNSFSLEVSGELDEGELASIHKLLQNVDNIASDFYQGRVDEAFQQTLDLEFDSTEFARLDLNLQQTTASTAVAAYESTASSNSNAPGQAASQLSQLLGNLKNTFEAARNFQEPLKLLNEALLGLEQIQNRAHLNNQTNGRHTPEILTQLIGNMAQKYLSA
ncbi:MAG: hypothetical protein ACI845_003608, partial [Gammaproteobacteria bacterium]